MRPQSDGERFRWRDILVLPEITHEIFCRRQPDLFPRIIQGLSNTVQIEYSSIITITSLRSREPQRRLFRREDWTIAGGVLIHGKHFVIGQERFRPLVAQREVSSHHQGRTKDRPERQLGALLVVSESRGAWVLPASHRFETAEREHVGVGPVAGSGEGRPLRGARKLILDAGGKLF